MIFRKNDDGTFTYIGHIVGFEDLEGWEDAEYINCLLTRPAADIPHIPKWTKREDIPGDSRWIPPPATFGLSVVVVPD